MAGTVYDSEGYRWQTRLVVFFLFIGTLVGVGSFISDVFSYLQFATYEGENNSGVLSLQDMKTTYFAFVIVAGIIYGLEVIFMLVAFIARWPRSSNGRQAIMWSRVVIAIIDSFLCDISFLVLYFLSFATGFCPMLRHMRTLKGQIAVSMTAIHAVFSFLQSVYYRRIVGRYPGNCERFLKKFCWVWHTIVAASAIFALIVAYMYYPIHTSMVRRQFRDWGFGQSETAPIYFIQDIHIDNVIQNQFNATKVDRSTKDDVFDERLGNILNCKQLRYGFHFSDLHDITESENGVSKTYKCSDVLTFYEEIIEDRHKNILGQVDCVLLVTAKFDFQTSLITYAIGYELRSINNTDECYGGFFNMAEPGMTDGVKYAIELSSNNTELVNSFVIGDTCSSTCYGNQTDVENVFSCLDKSCNSYKYDSSANPISVEASPFRVAWNFSTSYDSGLESLRSLTQCSVGIKVDKSLLSLCQNTTSQFSQGKILKETCS